jgi:hypothetical protein
VQAADAFVASLEPEQRAKTLFAFEDSEHLVWLRERSQVTELGALETSRVDRAALAARAWCSFL